MPPNRGGIYYGHSPMPRPRGRGIPVFTEGVELPLRRCQRRPGILVRPPLLKFVRASEGRVIVRLPVQRNEWQGL
jgi:hypothetical protein